MPLIEPVEIQQSFSIKIYRCYKCHRYWGCEMHEGGECPMCAHDDHQERARGSIKLERQNASLKGQITRLKKKLEAK